MNLWPVPDEDDGRYQLRMQRHRSIMDVGTLSQQVEVPTRWYEAVVAGLACKLAREIEEVDINMLKILDPDANAAFTSVALENRDNSPVNIDPGISGYTR